MNGSTQSIFMFMVNVGIVDVILPFIIVFAIVFGILEKTLIFGKRDDKPKTNINAIVAFCMAFIFVASLNLVNLMSTMIQYFVIAIVAVLCLFLIGGIFGVHIADIFKKK
jgi:hypothetical protein